jgi:hypothetical protein
VILERRPNDYTQRNLLLQLTLGLLASADTLDELLARHAPPGRDEAGEPEPAALAILGMIAFAGRLRAALADTAATPGPPAPPDRQITGLLR